MRLYQFTLPTHTNAGLSYELARKRFAKRALEIAGGYTELPIQKGVWLGEADREYKDTSIGYVVACEPAIHDALLAVAFDAFPDQEAIFVADLGEAVIHIRPGVDVAA